APLVLRLPRGVFRVLLDLLAGLRCRQSLRHTAQTRFALPHRGQPHETACPDAPTQGPLADVSWTLLGRLPVASNPPACVASVRPFTTAHQTGDRSDTDHSPHGRKPPSSPVAAARGRRRPARRRARRLRPSPGSTTSATATSSPSVTADAANSSRS